MLAIFDNNLTFNSIFTIYDYLDKKINNIKETQPLIKIYNLTPIIYKNMKFLVTSFLGLEHLFLEKNREINIKYFLDDKTFGDIKLTRYYNLLKKKNIDFDFYSNYDCFYDEHSQLLFIKFQDICIEYLEISHFNLTRLMHYNHTDEHVIIDFIDNSIKKNTFNNKISSNYIFKHKYVTLPPLPYLTINTNNDILPYKGSSIVNLNNDLIGIVNYLIDECIIITPLLSIIRSLKYFKNNVINTLFFDYTVEIHNEINILKINNLITTNSKKSKIINQNISICSLDNYNFDSDGNIIYNKNNKFPIYTYIWLNMINKIKITYFTDDKNIETKIVILKKWDKISNIQISKLKYINNKNTYIFELNEKILSIIKNYMFYNIEYHHLLHKINNNKFSSKRKNILLLIKIKKNKHFIDIIDEYNSLTEISTKLNSIDQLEINLLDKKVRLFKI